MVSFDFIQFGKDLGTRQLGVKARMALLPLLQNNDKVVLNFGGVNVVSNSFADECIAKLLMDMPLDDLKKKTTFAGLNPVAKESVLTALQRRYLALQTA